MSPKEYFQLLFQCFFKIYTLRSELETWDKSKSLHTILWASFYNGILSSLIICVALVICTIFHKPFYSLESFKAIFSGTIGSIVFGIIFAILLGVEWVVESSVIFGIMFSVVFGLVFGAVGSVVGSIIGSIALGIFFSVIVIMDEKLSVILGLLLGVFFGLAFYAYAVFEEGNQHSIISGLQATFFFILSYFLFKSRIYYFYYLPLYKTKNPLWWDENIGTSVPFLPRILRGYAKTKDFDKTIEFAKFLIEQRPVQRKVAQKGLILIALDRMKGFRTIDRMKELSKELSFLPYFYAINHTNIYEYQTEVSIIEEKQRKLKSELSTIEEKLRELETKPFLFEKSTKLESELYLLSEKNKESKEQLLSLETINEKLLKSIYSFKESPFILQYNSQLQSFLNISEDINKTWNELNRTNRINIYERVKQKLFDYHKAANLSNASFAKEFGEIADSWQKILSKTIEDLRASGKLPLPNPYTLGKAIQADSELFLGRRDLIQKIETETLREGAATALLFIGNRRTGKSSTLNNLQRFVQSSVRTVFADLQDAEVNNSTADFCETLTERIAKSLKIPRPTPPIQDFAAFTKWLKELDAELVRQNRYLLICIDEYERLDGHITQGKLTELPNTLRYWIQHLQHVVFLLAGSHEPAELKGGIDWTDYLINVRNVPISYLEYDAAMQLVIAPVPHFDLTWATDDLPHRLVMRLGRQPFLLQCAMWNLVEILNNQSSKHATPADIERALDKVVEGDASNHFSHFWHTEMTDATRHILSNLARNIQPTEGSVLNLLKRKEIVALVDGQYVFCVPLLREWILRNVD